ncbi:hypothetical protein SUGI_0446170 [Cryptomeria japonica]|nr:hypothetical protein SUGI_0446170 [Cryptomeria japonica]
MVIAVIVKARALIVKRADVSRGIVETVSELGIRKLVMGTSSAGGAKSKKSKVQRPGKAGYVIGHAINSCDISIVYKGRLVASREASVVNNEDFGRQFSFKVNFEPDLAASIKTPALRNFSVAGGLTQKQSCFEASLETTATISEHPSDIQLAESRQFSTNKTHEQRTDTETLKSLLTEALDVAENAMRGVQRETVRRKNAEVAVRKLARKVWHFFFFSIIEDAVAWARVNMVEFLCIY